MAQHNLFLVVGAIGGGAVYIAFRRWLKRNVNPFHLTESMGFAVGVVYGVHLCYAALDPTHLVHLTDANGGHVELSELAVLDDQGRVRDKGIRVEMGQYHTSHVFLAGIATTVGFGIWIYALIVAPHQGSSHSH